jgi:hypothetical protein
MAKYAWSISECAFDIKIEFASVSSEIVDWVFKFPASMRSLVSVGITTAGLC